MQLCVLITVMEEVWCLMKQGWGDRCLYLDKDEWYLKLFVKFGCIISLYKKWVLPCAILEKAKTQVAYIDCCSYAKYSCTL